MSKVKADEFSLTYNFEGQGNDGNSYQDTNTGFMIFGGNNKGGETTTSNVNIKSGYCYAVYGGNNEGGTNPTSNVTVDGGEPQEVYGGNNLGGENTDSKVIINSGKIQNVYGGGNKAVTNVPYVRIQGDAQISHSVYGGGNQAGINTDTKVEIFGGTIEGNAYGGGNEGTVTGNTYVHVKNATFFYIDFLMLQHPCYMYFPLYFFRIAAGGISPMLSLSARSMSRISVSLTLPR